MWLPFHNATRLYYLVYEGHE
ncbi:hypothetical protein PUN4_540045 [Paraburkholderia unamae]|nr:hypothetical protein PUN4_540045 [Paraburkholderia unamae]